jgi:hypothetical protein
MIPKSKIQNLKSRGRRRPAVTIVEVLFAIMVATVGLFSVIVIFPFASSQAKRARINDMLAAAGRSAFHDFDARGMRRPDRWLAWDPRPVGVGGQAFVPAANTIQRLPLPPESICIDPRTIAAHTTSMPLPPAPAPIWPNLCVQMMTASASASNPSLLPYPGGQCVQVFPYVSPATVPVFNGTYMRRITLWSGAVNNAGQKLAVTFSQANSIFQIDDDIAYTRDEKDKSATAKQAFVQLPTGEWLKRDTERKISWIATLVPQIDASGVISDQYTLSVVMIYDRPADLDNLEFTNSAGQPSGPKKERRVFGALQTTGATGGEIRIGSIYPDQLKLKPNEWVMVSGSYVPPPALPGSPALTRFQWYRVTESDSQPELIPNSNPPMYQIYATLIGQDWNTAFVAPAAAGFASTLEFPVNVDIVEGAFAVYEKTIRLEYGSAM